MTASTTLSRFDYGRGLAGGALVLLGFVTVGAAFSDAPGDRLGAVVFAPLVLLALIGGVRTRAATHGASPWLLALGLAQVAVGAILLAKGIGAPPVVLALTGLFASAWFAAAGLLRVNGASTGTQV